MTQSRNTLLKEAGGSFVVWLDADDYLSPSHASKVLAAARQVNSKACSIGIVGSWSLSMQSSALPVPLVQTLQLLTRISRNGEVHTFPSSNDAIRAFQCFGNCFTTSGTLIDLDLVRERELTFKNFYTDGAEDYDYWNQLILVSEARITRFPSVQYGLPAGTKSRRASVTRWQGLERNTQEIRRHFLTSLGFELSEDDRSLLDLLCHSSDGSCTPDQMVRLADWTNRLRIQNKDLKALSPMWLDFVSFVFLQRRLFLSLRGNGSPALERRLEASLIAARRTSALSAARFWLWKFQPYLI